jgi:hypothetical protein
MPSPRQIKIHNSAAFAVAIEELAKHLGLKPSTMAGGCLSVYTNTLLNLAETDLELVQRNLDRAILLFSELRQGTTAKEMIERMDALAAANNADVHAEDAKRRTH